MKSVTYILAARIDQATYYAKLMGFDLRRCAAITHPMQLRGVIRVADRDTVAFDAAKAAIFNAMGE